MPQHPTLNDGAQLTQSLNQLWQEVAERAEQTESTDTEDDAFWDQFIQTDEASRPTPWMSLTTPSWSPLNGVIAPADYFTFAGPPTPPDIRMPSPAPRPPSPRPQQSNGIHLTPTATRHAPPSPARRAASRRQRDRRRLQEQLRRLPIDQSTVGRSLLDLRNYPWHRLPNGLAVMQFGPDDAPYRPSDIASYINWLECGARAHRSNICHCLAVLHIENINHQFALCGRRPIMVEDGTPDWVHELVVRPPFLRDNFVSGVPRITRSQTAELNDGTSSE